MPDRKCFYRSLKDKTAGHIGEKLDGHISYEDYLTCKKKLGWICMKNMGDYHDHYFKNSMLKMAGGEVRKNFGH